MKTCASPSPDTGQEEVVLPLGARDRLTYHRKANQAELPMTSVTLVADSSPITLPQFDSSSDSFHEELVFVV